MRCAVSVSLLAMLGGCVGATVAPVASIPAATSLPKAPEVRITQEPGPVDFAFEGAITQGGAVIGTAPGGTQALTLDEQAVPVDSEGRFLIAFDRDAAPSATLVASLRDGRTLRHVLSISPRAWRLEKVDVALRPTSNNDAFMAVRGPELAQIVAARAVQSDSKGWRQRFAWPRTGRISGLFGAQRIYRGQPGAYHGGVDIAAAVGDVVRAPADGMVVLAADHPFTLEGNLLMIDHGAGLNSAFLHLSRIDVAVGARVVRGQVIGAAGATGRATGPHLHWAMMWNKARIDPLLLAGPMPGQ